MIDTGPPAAGVTNWTFSWLNASSKTETREYFDLSVAGMHAYRELAADIGPGEWWHPTGHLRWVGGSTETEELRASVEHLRGWGTTPTSGMPGR
jgi:hypothetical protein